jgi:inhibitor of cysteine peptidase
MKTLSILAALLFATPLAFSAEPPAAIPHEKLPPITAQVGEQFTVALDANPSTGYSWQIVGFDEAVVTLVSSEFKRADKPMPGASGKQIWTFKAIGKGETAIAFKYVRPWEKNTPPAKTANVAVTVK